MTTMRIIVQVYSSLSANRSFSILGNLLATDIDQTTIVFTSKDDTQKWQKCKLIYDEDQLWSILETCDANQIRRMKVLFINVIPKNCFARFEKYFGQSMDVLINVDYHDYKRKIPSFIRGRMDYLVIHVDDKEATGIVWKQLDEPERKLLLSKKIMDKCVQDNHAMIISYMSPTPLFFTLPHK
jgi:hypothetical protein